MRDYEFYYTQDGSIGLYSYADGDVYHSKFGALTEAWEKFVLPSGIDKLINTKENINVLDVCYGVGYNTKALMSYVINYNEKFLRKKNILKNFVEFLKKIKNKNKKNRNSKINNDSIYNDNSNCKNGNLSLCNETIHNDNIISFFNIDCLEMNGELVKLSPFLKTVFTPQEIYTKLVPKILDCFDTYWIIRNKLAKFTLRIVLKNRKHVNELLNLKYNNDYDLLNSNYKIHKFVNYIIINSLLDKYKDEFIDENLDSKLNETYYRRFYDKSKIKYAKHKQKIRYNLIYKLNLSAFLHNIYYRYFSFRYKKLRFNEVEKLFKLNYFINDARKSILSINRQYDLIFLDAFTFSKAPELWTVEFMNELYSRTSANGILITYSTSAQVRKTMLECKFFLGKIIDATTGKSIGTIAAKDKSMITNPLSNYELGLCATKAGIPYHDPSLNSSKDEILERRERAFKASNLMTSTQYMRLRVQKNEE